MAICHRITLYALVLLSLITLTHAEIHRAKTNNGKAGAKIGKQDYVADSRRVKLDIAGGEENSQEDYRTEKMIELKYETWFYSIFGAILVGLSGIFPLLVIPIQAGPALKHGVMATRLKLVLSFAVGSLLGDVFLHLLPEAWDHIEQDGHSHSAHTTLGLWVIAGMMSFLIIEKALAKEDEFDTLEDECSDIEDENEEIKHEPINHQMEFTHDHSANSLNIKNNIANYTRQRTKAAKNVNSNKSQANNSTVPNNNHSYINNNGKHFSSKAVNQKTSKEKSTSIKVSGYLNLAANVMDNFTHGLAVAGGFLVSNKVGFLTLIAILLHEIPHEIGDFAILLRSGFDRWKAAKAQLLTATGGMVGALTALTADSAQAAGDSTAWILPFTSGGFLYIALVTVVPDLLKEKHPRESALQIVCLLLGISVMYGVSLLHT